MKQLVILSGKGGAGKTSVSASLAHLASLSEYTGKVVLVDADVDAANLELLVAANPCQEQAYSGGEVAVIDWQACIQCGQCIDACRYDAIHYRDERGLVVDGHACEGCAACFYLCPTNAISRQPRTAGRWFVSATPYGRLFHAALRPGEENSGKLVNIVREKGKQYAAEHEASLILVDGPPGTGCPAIAAISQADHCLLVTEPSLSGQHDLARVLALTKHFGMACSVCINKADLYPEGSAAIHQATASSGVPVLAELPFDPNLTQAMIAGQPITAFAPDAPFSQSLQVLWEKLLPLVFKP